MREEESCKGWKVCLWKHPVDMKVVTDHLPALNFKQKQEGTRLQPYLPKRELLLEQFQFLPSLQSCDNLLPVCLQLSILRPSLVFLYPVGSWLTETDELTTMVNFLLLNSPDKQQSQPKWSSENTQPEKGRTTFQKQKKIQFWLFFPGSENKRWSKQTRLRKCVNVL